MQDKSSSQLCNWSRLSKTMVKETVAFHRFSSGECFQAVWMGAIWTEEPKERVEFLGIVLAQTCDSWGSTHHWGLGSGFTRTLQTLLCSVRECRWWCGWAEVNKKTQIQKSKVFRFWTQKGQHKQSLFLEGRKILCKWENLFTLKRIFFTVLVHKKDRANSPCF